LEGDAPGIAQHDEERAVGLWIFEEEGGAGAFEAGALAFRIEGDDGHVKHEWVLPRVVGDRGFGIRVELQHGAAGVIGEEVGERGIVSPARNRETEVRDIPRSLGDGIGDVEGEVFEFHAKAAAVES
jgi:hypothetical protein